MSNKPSAEAGAKRRKRSLSKPHLALDLIEETWGSFCFKKEVCKYLVVQNEEPNGRSNLTRTAVTAFALLASDALGSHSNFGLTPEEISSLIAAAGNRDYCSASYFKC